MQHELDAMRMVQRTMANMYSGRRFLLDGGGLCADDAFAPEGALPLFAARASRRYKLAHGAGIRLERCLRCGAATPPATGLCYTPCPKRVGEHRIDELFGFELENREMPNQLLPVRLTLPPYRAQVYISLYFLLDAAQEMLLQSPSPRNIPIDDLQVDLGIILRKDLTSAVESMRAASYPHAKEFR